MAVSVNLIDYRTGYTRPIETKSTRWDHRESLSLARHPRRITGKDFRDGLRIFTASRVLQWIVLIKAVLPCSFLLSSLHSFHSPHRLTWANPIRIWWIMWKRSNWRVGMAASGQYASYNGTAFSIINISWPSAGRLPLTKRSDHPHRKCIQLLQFGNPFLILGR